MKHKPVLTRDDVARILDHARAEALANQWAVTIAIVDDGGHPLALERLDGAAPVSAYIATEKARTSAMGRRPSADYEEMINGGRNVVPVGAADRDARRRRAHRRRRPGGRRGGRVGREVQPGRAGRAAPASRAWRDAPSDSASGRRSGRGARR